MQYMHMYCDFLLITDNFLQMAEAGFFHCPNDDEPDLVQCFVCHKKLHGWEPDEEPWYF